MTTRTDMLTAAAVRAELARLTYKPGWTFRCTSGPWSPNPILLIDMPVPDTYNPDRTTTVNATIPIPPFLPPDEVLDWVRSKAITHVELHERDEWFLVDGQRIYDPHKEGTPVRQLIGVADRPAGPGHG